MDIEKAVRNLAGLVFNVRTKMKLRQANFGKFFGASNATVSNIENGNYLDLPEHRTLNEFATKILKIEYWELIKLLHENGKANPIRPISKDEIIAGLELQANLDDLYDVHSALAKRIDEVRATSEKESASN